MQTTQPSPDAGTVTLAGKYLTFQVGEENYGIPALRTREIIRLPKITLVPDMPPHVRGVIRHRARLSPFMRKKAAPKFKPSGHGPKAASEEFFASAGTGVRAQTSVKGTSDFADLSA